MMPRAAVDKLQTAMTFIEIVPSIWYDAEDKKAAKKI